MAGDEREVRCAETYVGLEDAFGGSGDGRSLHRNLDWHFRTRLCGDPMNGRMVGPMTSQNEAILRHLKERGSITPMEAMDLYGCFRLAARIDDLKRDGVGIKTEMESKTGKRWARYSLTEKGKQGDLFGATVMDAIAQEERR